MILDNQHSLYKLRGLVTNALNLNAESFVKRISEEVLDDDAVDAIADKIGELGKPDLETTLAEAPGLAIAMPKHRLSTAAYYELDVGKVKEVLR